MAPDVAASPPAPGPTPGGMPDPPPTFLVRLRGQGAQMLDRFRSSAAMQASWWTAFQFAASMGLRFVSNVALAHLLFPEAFGLVNMVYVVMVALAMFSDLGLGQSIIQHPRGDEKAFYDTAFTVQAIRGGILWLISAAIAWPVAAYFSMPELLYLLPAIGITALIQGFDSTAFWSLKRRLDLRRTVILEFITQIVGTLVTIAVAVLFYFNRPQLESAGWNVKLLGAGTLAVGALLTPLLRMLASHVILVPGYRNQFRIERQAFDAIFHFGKWIFLSTFLAFFTQQMDRLLVGKLLGERALGIYSVGQNFATMLPNAVMALGAAVVFPVLSRIAREAPERMRPQVLRARTVLLLPSVAGLIVLALGGDWLVWLIYPRSFHDAGWTLQLLSIGACGMLVSTTYGNAMLAQGRSRELTIILCTQIVFLFGGSLLGYYFLPRFWPGGQAPAWAPMAGLVGGFALTEWLNYPVVLWRARVRGIENARLDALVFLSAALAALAALFLMPSAPP